MRFWSEEKQCFIPLHWFQLMSWHSAVFIHCPFSYTCIYSSCVLNLLADQAPSITMCIAVFNLTLHLILVNDYFADIDSIFDHWNFINVNRKQELHACRLLSSGTAVSTVTCSICMKCLFLMFVNMNQSIFWCSFQCCQSQVAGDWSWLEQLVGLITGSTVHTSKFL